MSTTETTTNETTIKQIGSQEQDMRNLLASTAQGSADQLGNLTDLANGNLQLSPQDAALIRQIQELSGQAARGQMQDNAAMQSSQLEDRLLGKGMGGASVEAVNEALIGRQLTSDLNQSVLQGQIQGAQQMRQGVLDTAGIKLNANQLLLSNILQGAGAVSSMGLEERLVQRKDTQTTEGNAMNTAMQLGKTGGRLAAGIMTGGASEAGLSAAGQLSDSYSNPQNYTTDIYGD